MYFRKSTIKRSTIIHFGIWSLRIAISASRVIFIFVVFMLLSLLMIVGNDERKLPKNIAKDIEYTNHTTYLQKNKSERTKRDDRTIPNIYHTIVETDANNKSLGNTIVVKTQLKGNVNTKSKHQIKSPISKPSKNKAFRQNNKIKLKEIPFNVTGWPIGSSFSAEDYVDYFHKTSIFSPDVSKDSSMFDESNDYSVLVAVASNPSHKTFRDAIRNSWGFVCKHLEWCSYVFIVGCTFDDVIENQIKEEHLKYNDILKESFVDTYNNLTLKSIFALKHFVTQRVRLRYLLKVDDDSYVNILGLLKMLKENIQESDNKRSIYGYLQRGLKAHHWLPKVHRPTMETIDDKKIYKWIVPRYLYRKRLFPQFIAGAGYLVERQNAECLFRASQTVSIIHLEDVYITGLCALKCHLKRIHHAGFKARKDDATQLLISPFDVLIHYANESTMKYLHNLVVRF